MKGTDQALTAHLAREVGAMRSKWTEEKIERWRKEGRGQGSGSNYKPWLTVHDLSSTGRCHRLFSWRLGRRIELFSDIEKGAFLVAERSPRMVDAQEQWPIDRDLSTSVARAMGVRHPCYPGTHVPVVLTVDLLVTSQEANRKTKIGIDCKPTTRLEDPRTIEKLQLTRACLAHLGHRHLIVLDSHLPKQLIKNLEWVRSSRAHEGEVLPYPNYLEEVTDRFHRHLSTLLW